MVIANCSAETADRIQSPSSDVQTGDAGRHLYDEIGDYGCLNVTTADNAGLAPETRRTSADWSQAYEASFFNKDDFSDIYGDLDRAGPLTSDRPAALGEEINSEGVKQGSSGTCFFMSSLASLANTEAGQKQIADMVRENPDGTFTVTFPGDQDNPVTIDDIGSKANDGAAKWAQVIETAFLKYTHDGPLRDTVDLQDVSVTARVNNSKTAQKLLTGKDSMNDQFAFTDMASGLSAIGSTSMDNVERDLEEAIKNGRVITAGTAPDGILGTGSNDSGPVRDGHIFTVMNYDSETKTVTVRDPYGNSGIAEGETVDGITALPNGELKMSLDKFYNTFSNMTISGRSQAGAVLDHTVNDLKNLDMEAVANDLLFFSSGMIRDQFFDLKMNPPGVVDWALDGLSGFEWPDFEIVNPVDIAGSAGDYVGSAIDVGGDIAGGVKDKAGGVIRKIL